MFCEGLPCSLSMQRHCEQLFWHHGSPTTLPHSGLTARVAFPRDHRNAFVGGESLDAINLCNDPSPSRVEGSLTNGTESEDVEFLVLTERTNEPQEYPPDDSLTNPTLTSVAPETIPSLQLPSPDLPSSDPQTMSIIPAEDQSFRCSWYSHSSVEQCNHVAPDRLAFLHHLRIEHQDSGSQDAIIICQLFDSMTGSVCNRPIKKGNFPRHADRHYHVRFYCQHCPAGKSFSRKDSWRKHVKSKHA